MIDEIHSIIDVAFRKKSHDFLGSEDPGDFRSEVLFVHYYVEMDYSTQPVFREVSFFTIAKLARRDRR